MTKYLYGASVQGIQSFIFETNKLKEIVGASELVEQICTNWFAEAIGKKADDLKTDKNVIMTAAGNIKYVFDEKEKEKLEFLVCNFPKHISNFAPGITISQAVQVIEESKGIQFAIDEVEKKLKIQRNKAEMPIEIGFMGLERARKTGKVAFLKDKDKNGKEEIIDKGTKAKREETQKSKRLFANFTGKKEHEIKIQNIPLDIEKITGKSENSWLAIIHADGNGLGSIIQNLSNEIKDGEKAQKAFKIFSQKLEDSTNEAAQLAFNTVVDKKWQLEIEKSDKETYPIRPVVLGGDDLTLIIRANLAYEFTKTFLKEFETRTKENFKALEPFGIKDKYLTACAGIAYIKDNYPFHYGVHLAENLVKEAKKMSKDIDQNLPPSSLSFYKVQSSFTDKLSEMKKRTHFVEESKISFDFGPYLIHKMEGKANVEELDDLLCELQEFKTDKSKGVSKLRQWISELYKDKSKADFMLERIKSVNDKFYNALKLKEYSVKDKLIYKDLIDLHTFKNLYHED